MASNQILIDAAFEKKYKLKNDYPNLNLPVNTLFSVEPWTDPLFMEIKTLLNKQKNRLNVYDLLEWQNHTYNTNPAKIISKEIKLNIQPELFTVAWSKFYECACSFDLIPEQAKRTKKLRSLHLCEAPGAFVTSFNHFLKINYVDLEWKWMASTLNPYYGGNCSSSMINDDRFIKHTLNNWNFGLDYTGDIMNWQNSQYIIKKMKEIGEVNIVTSDGSIDCSLNPEEQESIVASLHFCEAVTALQVLMKGGTFILKLFTVFEHFSINLVYLLVNCFEEVNFFKPCTSKAGNSEIYVVCLKYKGIIQIETYLQKIQSFYGTKDFSLKSMFPHNLLPKLFIEDLLQASNFYFKHQCNQIDNNIKLYESNSKYVYKRIRTIQYKMKDAFFMKYKLEKIDDAQMICDSSCYDQTSLMIFNNSSFHNGSFYARTNFANNLWNERREQIKEKIKLLDVNFHSDIEMKCENLQNTNLLFTSGKPIEKIKSSKFINSSVFKLYIESNDYVSETLDYSNMHTTLYSANVCTIIFCQHTNHHIYDGWEKSFVRVLRNSINIINEHDAIVLKNFDITMTQFGVGILYILATIGFEKLIFKQDFSINLINMKNRNDLLHRLDEILDEINILKKNSQSISIQGVISLEILLTGVLYSNINTFNTSKMYEFIQSKLND